MSSLKKGLIKIFLLIFLIFFLFFSNALASITKDEVRKSIYDNSSNRITIDYLFGSKEEFEKHFDLNYSHGVDDELGYSYMRKLKEQEIEKRKKEKQALNGIEEGKEEGISKGETFNIDINGVSKSLVGDDSVFIFEMLFGTSDLNKLQRAGFLPEKDSFFYDFTIGLYGILFSFFILVGSLVIIFFIFSIIANPKQILGKGGEGKRFGKIEEYIIGFIIVVIILFGGIRLYLLILESGVRDFQTDLNSVGIESEITSDDINEQLNKINILKNN